MKSNLPRSAIRANRLKESNSMWLPAAGSLHTVVLFTPGKCAARWICFFMAGVLGFVDRAASLVGLDESNRGEPVGRGEGAEQGAGRLRRGMRCGATKNSVQCTTLGTRPSVANGVTMPVISPDMI